MIAANRLDAVPGASQPWRSKDRTERITPYFLEAYAASSEEHQQEEQEERLAKMTEELKPKTQQDYWQIDDERGVLTRHHQKKRKAVYDPKKDPSFPVRWEEVEETRRTIKRYGNSAEEVAEEDNWLEEQKERRSTEGWWKGRTEFRLKEKVERKKNHLEESISCWMADKRKPEEVDLRFETKEAIEGWKKADKAEWCKIVEGRAIQVLSLKESIRVKEELRKKGQMKRILPSKMLRKYKHSEQPGEPPTQKSRLCIRGDQDPDLLGLDRFSPTVTTMNLNVMLQIAANLGMWAAIGDLKNAFCQSDPLQREQGDIYFAPPKGCLEEELDPGQIIKVINGCYGLVDAPRDWRLSLIKTLKSLGYVESRLDPCIYCLFRQGKLAGLVAVEVDDLLTAGNHIHDEQMRKLRSIYQFGKWVDQKTAEKGASFNGRRIQQDADGTFRMDMQKFVEERLQPIDIDKERKKSKDEEVTEEERKKARTACGAMNWLSKEGRPDAAAAASLYSSKLNRMKVEDLMGINQAIAEIKKNPGLETKIQPLKNMRLAVITDASFGNNGFHSQGGQMIISHEAGLKEGRQVKANLLWWRSGKLQRVVNSTLAAETQSLSKGIGDLMWMLMLFKELQSEGIQLRKWTEGLEKEEVVVMSAEEASDTLKESLAVVDAKSLYDYLAKETIGGQDRRTAIEVQIIREDLKKIGGSIRWVDHQAMIADTLTKVKGAKDSLYRMLETGHFSIQAEQDRMKERSCARMSGQTASEIRRKGIKVDNKVGELSVHCHVSTMLQP